MRRLNTPINGGNDLHPHMSVKKITSLNLVKSRTQQIPPNSNTHCAYAGRMFGFNRKKFCGSYCFLICTSLGRFEPKLSFMAF
jgi:hypothetical protein